MHDSEIPAHGQQVITVVAFIHHKFDGVEKVFLPLRAHTKKFLPEIYELPGGHINFGEDIVEGLKREVREELSKEITVGEPFYVFTYMNNVKGAHAIEVVYFAEFVDNPLEIHLHPEDHSEYGWFSQKEILTKVVGVNKEKEDPEVQAILKGFTQLNT